MSGIGSKRDRKSNGKRGKSSKRKTRTKERQIVQLSATIPSQSLQSHTGPLHINESSSHHPNLEVNKSQSRNTKFLPPIIPSRHLYSQINEPPLQQPSLEVNRSQPHNTESQTQSNQSQPINQNSEHLISPPVNKTSVTSSTTINNGDDNHQIWIVPEEDGFDPHKIVIEGIASCIRSKFELARPSWKKFPVSIHDMWFEEFKKKFKWLPHYTDAIRRNFEKRAAARMTQLFQDVRKNLPLKPHWMGDAVFKEMKEHWESPAFKKKSEQNKKKS